MDGMKESSTSKVLDVFARPPIQCSQEYDGTRSSLRSNNDVASHPAMQLKKGCYSTANQTKRWMG